MKKKIISTIIAAAMTASLIPASFADSTSEIHLSGNYSSSESIYYEDYGLYFDANTGSIVDSDNGLSGAVVIPDEFDGVAVTIIDDYAFAKEYDITSVTLPEGITSINFCAFNHCSELSSINIPASVTLIEQYAFDDCPSLADVYYSGTSEDWQKIEISSDNNGLDNATIHYESTTPAVPTQTPLATIVPETPLPTIYPTAEPTIPSPSLSPTSTPLATIVETGNYGNNITWTLDEEGTLILSGTGMMPSYFSMQCPFYNNQKIQKVIIGEGILSVSRRAFAVCMKLKSVEFPEGLETIGNEAFYGASLTSIRLPSSITAIGGDAFECTYIKDVYYDGTETQWNEIQTKPSFSDATIHFAEEDIDPDKPLTVIKVIDSQSSADNPVAIKNAQVRVCDAEGNVVKSLKTKDDGTVTLNIDNGVYAMSVSASGYPIRTATIEISDDTNEFTVYMSKESILKVETDVKEMTKQDMIDAGIDTEALENKQVYNCVTALQFEKIPNPIKINYVYSDNKIVKYEPVKVRVPDYDEKGGKVLTIYPVAKDVFLIIHSSTTWLKEMFDVELLAANTSSFETLESCTANLVLPDGLSLAAMVDEEQSVDVTLGNIAPGATANHHWYIRGDKEGEYLLKGSVKAQRVGGGISENMEVPFSIKEPITVLAGSAMNLKIYAEKTAVSGKPYKVKYVLENVSDKTLYDVELRVLKGQFCEAYDVSEIKNNPLIMGEDAFKGDIENGFSVSAEEFAPEQALSGIFEITFGEGLDIASGVEYMVENMFTFVGEGSTTVIPTTVELVDSITYDDISKPFGVDIMKKVDTEAKTVTFIVTATDKSELEGINLYTAEYDNGALTNVTLGTKSEISGNSIIITAPLLSSQDYRYMLWDKNNAPLMKAITNITI